MKKYLFLYSESAEHTVWESESYENHLFISEASFPKATSDWEITEEARKLEEDHQWYNKNRAGERCFTRKLMRILEIAREVGLED